MQFQVPQFIEVEDKIVGPSSLRQFLYVCAGVGAALLLYFLLVTWLWAIFAIILVGASLAIAFVKINGQPLLRVMLAAFHFYWRPQKYIWRPETPNVGKAESLSEADRFSIEKLVSGISLKTAWQKVQVGEGLPLEEAKPVKDQAEYEVFGKLSGERRAAKRVDYR